MTFGPNERREARCIAERAPTFTVSTLSRKSNQTIPGSAARILWFNKPERVSAATALSLVLRLRSKNDKLFSFLLGEAPPSVIREISMHYQGLLIPRHATKGVCRFVTKSIAGPSTPFNRLLADVGSNPPPRVVYFRGQNSNNSEKLSRRVPATATYCNPLCLIYMMTTCRYAYRVAHDELVQNFFIFSIREALCL